MTRTDLVVSSEAQVGRARRMAAAAAQEAGLPMERVHRIALAATELATNLVKHAGSGVFAVVPGPGQLDLVATDTGPGMQRGIEESLRDGCSTAGTMGTGLGAIRRAADFFDAFTLPGRGTTVLGRWRHGDPVRGLRIGAARLTAPGETEPGDMWIAVGDGTEFTVALSDGLGHGEAAAKASETALSALVTNLAAGPARILEAMHQPLARTRGATVAVARMTPTRATFRFAGIGNISARRYDHAADSVHRLLSRPGIVGLPGTRAVESTESWSPNAWLVLHTDGVSDRWSAADWPGLLRHDPAVVAGWILAQGGRGRDDACVVAVTGGER